MSNFNHGSWENMKKETPNVNFSTSTSTKHKLRPHLAFSWKKEMVSVGSFNLFTCKLGTYS